MANNQIKIKIEGNYLNLLKGKIMPRKKKSTEEEEEPATQESGGEKRGTSRSMPKKEKKKVKKQHPQLGKQKKNKRGVV